MSYTMARFSRMEEPKSVLELVQETFQTTLVAASLSAFAQRQRTKARSDRRAKIAITFLMEKIGEEGHAEETHSGIGSVLRKIVTFVGKKIFKAVARRALTFAARVAMNIVRIAAQSILRFAIIPALEVAVAVIVANPVTAAIALSLAAAGGGYVLWKKFFGDKTEEAPAVEEQVPQMAPAEGQAAEAPPVQTKSFMDYVRAPVEYAKELVIGKQRFTGFGADVDAYVKEAATKYGIPEDILRGFVKMEGGWTGKMSPTGAIGTGQFIQPTWDSLAKTPEGAAIGMTVIGKRFRTPQDPRYDKRINTLATGLLASQNATLLRNAGLPVTGENLYMVHNIGPGIIQVMLGLPASPQTLKAMQQNGMLKGQNAAQFLAYQKGRFNTAYQQANSSSVLTGDRPTLADGQTFDKKPKVVALNTSAPTAGRGASSSSNSPDKTIIKGKGKSLIEVT